MKDGKTADKVVWALEQSPTAPWEWLTLKDRSAPGLKQITHIAIHYQKKTGNIYFAVFFHYLHLSSHKGESTAKNVTSVLWFYLLGHSARWASGSVCLDTVNPFMSCRLVPGVSEGSWGFTLQPRSRLRKCGRIFWTVEIDSLRSLNVWIQQDYICKPCNAIPTFNLRYVFICFSFMACGQGIKGLIIDAGNILLPLPVLIGSS